MKKRIGVASAVVAAAAALTSTLLARRAKIFAQAPPQRNETFATSAGPVELPVRYHDGSLMGAFWLVEETRAAELLPDNLEPLLLPGRNAAAGLFMMDYRNSTLGPYGEVGIGIQAIRKGTGATLIGYLWDMVANMFHVDEMLSLFEQDDSGMHPCGNHPPRHRAVMRTTPSTLRFAFRAGLYSDDASLRGRRPRGMGFPKIHGRDAVRLLRSEAGELCARGRVRGIAHAGLHGAHARAPVPHVHRTARGRHHAHQDTRRPLIPLRAARVRSSDLPRPTCDHLIPSYTQGAVR